jgi:WD40 repeat protein
MRPTLRQGGQFAQLVGLTAAPVASLAALGTDKCAALSPDGITRVWDIRSGDLEQTLVSGTPAGCLAASADGRVLAVGTDDGTVILWDVGDGVEAGRFHAHRWEVTAVAFLPDPAGLITGSGDGTVARWSSVFGEHGEALFQHEGWVARIAVDPGSGAVVTCGSDGAVGVWRSKSSTPGSRPASPARATAWANDVAIAPDGTDVAVAYEDGTVALWPAARAGAEVIASVSPSWAGAVAFAADGTRIACGDSSGAIHVWNTRSRQLASSLTGHTEPVTALVPLADGTVLSAADDGQILRWDLAAAVDGGEAPDTHADCVSGLAMHPAGGHAVSAGHDGTVRAWTLPDGRPRGVLATHGWKCMSVAFASGDLVVSAGTDGMLRLWAWPSGRAVGTLAGHANSVNWVCVTPDGHHAISASEDATVRVWDLRIRAEVRRYQGHEQGVRSVAVAPGGDRIVSVSVDGTLRIWDPSGRQLAVHDANQDWVNGVAVTPDGRYALSASDRPAAQLMLTDMATGRPVVSWQGHVAPAFDVTCTADGRRAVSAGLDGRLRVWDMVGAVPRAPSLICEFTVGEQLYSCAVSRDTRTIMTGAQSGRVHTVTLHEDRYGAA